MDFVMSETGLLFPRSRPSRAVQQKRREVPEELIGLHPTAPMARYDFMGMLWMLRGERVSQLTDKLARLIDRLALLPQKISPPKRWRRIATNLSLGGHAIADVKPTPLGTPFTRSRQIADASFANQDFRTLIIAPIHH
jgi:hypothetical protein